MTQTGHEHERSGSERIRALLDGRIDFVLTILRLSELRFLGGTGDAAAMTPR